MYPCKFGGVNRNVDRAVRRTGWLLAMAPALFAGCVAPATVKMSKTRPATLAVTYSVATAATCPGGLDRTLERDLAAIAGLDLDTLLVRHADPEDLPLVLSAAHRNGMTLIVNDPRSMRYVCGGDARDLGFTGPESIPVNETVRARFIGRIVDDLTLSRAREVAARAVGGRSPIRTAVEVDAKMISKLDSGDFDYVICRRAADGEPVADTGPSRGGLMTISCRVHRRDELTTVRHWLAQYHLGLLSGRSGGFVLDAYRALPGNWEGIVQEDHPPSPERIAMIRRIAARASRWGPRLAGLSALPVSPMRPTTGQLRVAALRGSKQRYLLIINASPAAFAREVVTVSAQIGEFSVTRAVHVPTAEDTLIGPVHDALGGRLAIPVQLSPGEAVLYELF